MTAFFRRHPFAFGLGAFALLVLLMSSVSIVPETSQGVIARFEKPVFRCRWTPPPQRRRLLCGPSPRQTGAVLGGDSPWPRRT